MVVNRATLPEEFFDITSTAMLVQPEPQYLHCQLMKSAMAASFESDAMLGMSPGRQFGGSGPPYVTAEDGRLTLSDPILSQAVEFVSELGNSPGHTVRLNRVAYADTTYTEASRTVASGTTISAVPINVASEQVPVTLKRYAGPYDAGNTRVAPIGVDRFDTSVMLHRPAMVAGATLKRDFDRTLDTFGVNLFDGGAVLRPNGMTNDNTPAVVGDYPLSWKLLTDVERDMDEANIPTFADGRRVIVLRPRQCQDLVNDQAYVRQSKYHEKFNPLFQGSYIESVAKWHVFRSNTLLQPTNTNSIPIQRAQAFGPGSVGAGQGELPRTAHNTQDNYGETALVIWLWYAGFGRLDSRFQRSVRTS